MTGGGMNARLHGLVDGFAGKTLVVVGDLIRDEYLYGKPARISREAPVLTRLSSLAARADAILVSDYGYGTVTPRAFDRIRAIARRTGAVVTVDSRYSLLRFTGVTAATPNEAELAQLAGALTDGEREVEKAGRQLLERLDARFLLVTRGSRGMALLERDGP